MYRPVLRSAQRVGRLRPEHQIIISGAHGIHYTRSGQSDGKGDSGGEGRGEDGNRSSRGGGSSAKTLTGLAATVAVLAGAAAFIPQPESMIASSSAAQSMPRIRQLASEDEVPLESPSKVITMEKANAKLRKQMYSFNFESQDGNRGRIDIARVPSNEPVEDDWSVGVTTGPGGKQLAMAGVYDGHA